jgi:RHH-type proline utilization regulon transcriptional repressor/proline dehydrogenase/delta 1-pyrroline-5-carboxylate dehydrogenase
MALAPRGRVLCLGPDADLLLAQAGQALAEIAVDVVASAADEDRQRALRRALASRKGPIVPLVGETLAPAAYAQERAVCVDTTAAGGNASLLAAA